jgi:hypothetical protein
MRLLCLILLFGSTSFAAPIALPEWAKPIEHLLPQLPPEVISEVDDLYTYWEENSETFNPAVREKYNRVAQRMVELREQVGAAMAWQYLKPLGVSRRSNLFFLNSLKYDDQLAKMMLPILRCRIGWFHQMIHDRRIKEFENDFDYQMELRAIEQYLYSHGEPSDFEALDRVFEEIMRQANQEISLRETPEQRGEIIKMARDPARGYGTPFWHVFANHLIEQGLLDQKVLLTQNSATQLGFFSGAHNPSTHQQTSSATTQPILHAAWSVLAAVGLGGALLFWLHKRTHE